MLFSLEIHLLIPIKALRKQSFNQALKNPPLLLLLVLGEAQPFIPDAQSIFLQPLEELMKNFVVFTISDCFYHAEL
jgi:hypothetical protein